MSNRYGPKCDSCSCGDQCDENGRCPDGVTGLTTSDDVREQATPSGVNQC